VNASADVSHIKPCATPTVINIPGILARRRRDARRLTWQTRAVTDVEDDAQAAERLAFAVPPSGGAATASARCGGVHNVATDNRGSAAAGALRLGDQDDRRNHVQRVRRLSHNAMRPYDRDRHLPPACGHRLVNHRPLTVVAAGRKPVAASGQIAMATDKLERKRRSIPHRGIDIAKYDSARQA
jgi:hypothetical protein